MKSRLSLCLFAATLALPAFAVDGVTLINQSTVTTSGGFPLIISQPGSYRLSSDLIVPASAVGAIEITGPNVTLDLNGFSILCNVCNSTQLASGIAIFASAVSVSNGAVTGFTAIGDSGISVQSNGSVLLRARIDHIISTGNADGITATSSTDITVIDSICSDNRDGGIDSVGRTTVLDSTISNNGVVGVRTDGGVVSRNQIVGNGNTPDPNFLVNLCGIDAGGDLTITNNTISNNHVGIVSILAAGNTAVIGFGFNTFSGNGQDLSGNRLVSMMNNVSGTGVF